MTTKGIKRQIFVAFIATIGAMAIGTILGWSSPAEKMLVSDGAVQFDVDSKQLTTIGAVLGIGALVGTIPAGKVMDMLGRRYAMIAYAMFVIVGWVLLTVPDAMWMLYAGRSLQGVGVGALCTIIPPYVAEISQPHLRGKLGAMFQLFITLGILYSYVIGTFMNYTFFNGLCGFWALLHVVGLIFILESPYHLLNKNKEAEANASLAKLRAGLADDVVKAELAVLKADLDAQKSKQNNLWKVLANKVNRKAMLIGIGCMFFQQMSGINIVIFFMNSIFGNASVEHTIDSEISSIIIGIIQVLMTLVSLLIIDNAGRRILLITSALLMCVTLACLVACIMLKDKYESSKIFVWLPLTVVAVYISAFSIGFGPIPWIVMGEIFSTEVKPFGTSLVTGVNWSLVFLVTYLKMTTVYINFIVAAVFCLMAAIFVWFLVPETRNKSLAVIQAELAGNTTTTRA